MFRLPFIATRRLSGKFAAPVVFFSVLRIYIYDGKQRQAQQAFYMLLPVYRRER